jgi:hypothetical protein
MQARVTRDLKGMRDRQAAGNASGAETAPATVMESALQDLWAAKQDHSAKPDSAVAAGVAQASRSVRGKMLVSNNAGKGRLPGVATPILTRPHRACCGYDCDGDESHLHMERMMDKGFKEEELKQCTVCTRGNWIPVSRGRREEYLKPLNEEYTEKDKDGYTPPGGGESAGGYVAGGLHLC